MAKNNTTQLMKGGIVSGVVQHWLELSKSLNYGQPRLQVATFFNKWKLLSTNAGVPSEYVDASLKDRFLKQFWGN